MDRGWGIFEPRKPGCFNNPLSFSYFYNQALLELSRKQGVMKGIYARMRMARSVLLLEPVVATGNKVNKAEIINT